MAAVVVTSQPHPEGAHVGGGWHERNDATNNHVTHQHISHAASLPLVGFIGNDKFGDQDKCVAVSGCCALACSLLSAFAGVLYGTEICLCEVTARGCPCCARGCARSWALMWSGCISCPCCNCYNCCYRCCFSCCSCCHCCGTVSKATTCMSYFFYALAVIPLCVTMYAVCSLTQDFGCPLEICNRICCPHILVSSLQTFSSSSSSHFVNETSGTSGGDVALVLQQQQEFQRIEAQRRRESQKNNPTLSSITVETSASVVADDNITESDMPVAWAV